MKTNEGVMPELDSLLNDIPEFQPFAYYDKHLDCIRVQILDCSVTEERVNKFFTILKPNHLEISPELVGFNIKGISHLFHDLDLPLTGVVSLTSIIDAIVKKYPEESVDGVARTVKTQNEFDNIEVNFDLPEAA